MKIKLTVVWHMQNICIKQEMEGWAYWTEPCFNEAKFLYCGAVWVSQPPQRVSKANVSSISPSSEWMVLFVCLFVLGQKTFRINLSLFFFFFWGWYLPFVKIFFCWQCQCQFPTCCKFLQWKYMEKVLVTQRSCW